MENPDWISSWDSPHAYAEKMEKKESISLLVPVTLEQKLPAKNVLDTYENNDAMPGWYQKLTAIHAGNMDTHDAYEPKYARKDIQRQIEVGDEDALALMEAYTSALKAFVPEDPLDNDEINASCQKLEESKKYFCDKVQPSSAACNPYDDSNVMREKHNNFMACRNMRAIETTSHCRINRGHYKYPHDEGHIQQTVMRGTSAEKCRKLYKTLIHEPTMSYSKKDTYKHAIYNRNTKQRHPPKNLKDFLPRRSTRRRKSRRPRSHLKKRL